MLCERCKLREATIQYTEVVNGVKREHNFCAQCAKELNLGDVSAIFDSDFPFSKILSALLGEEGTEEKTDFSQIVCPNCHTAYLEFVQNSRFGCPDCYGVFDVLMSDSIKQLQGSDTHKGKRPKYGMLMKPEARADGPSGNGGETQNKDSAVNTDEQVKPDGKRAKRTAELCDLRSKLNQAVKEEQYEMAARYRDRIRELEKGKEDEADA